MDRVALVNMPWSSLKVGSIALGILKNCLQREQITADVLYLNMRLARLMDLKIYERISLTHLIGEWLFSQHLFGAYGSGELKNSYADIVGDDAANGNRYVASLLKGMGIDFEYISQQIISQFIDACLTDVRWENYRVVGFTSVFGQNLASLLLAKKIKDRFPTTSIVFGGANVQSPMGQALLTAFDWVDYVVDGEGEATFPALVKNIFRGNPYKRLPRVSFRRGDDVIVDQGPAPLICLNDSPIPDYTDYFQQLTSSGLLGPVEPVLLFESSRGCWWGEKVHCTFCGLNGQSMKYRSKSPERIVHEVLAQSRRYKTLVFEAVDNILDMDAFSDLLPQLAGGDFDLELFYEVKSSLTKKQVEMLQAAGVRHIQPGMESLDTEILRLMRKGVTAMQNIQLLKWCREREINVLWNLLYGFPGETPAQYKQMLETISLITHLQPPSQAPRIQLQRFSPYYAEAERFGIRNIKPESLYYYIYPEAKVSLNDIAYYFDYSLDRLQEDPERYIRPLKETIVRWHKAFSKRKIFFQFRRGPEFIELQDNRPLSSSEEVGRTRRIVLTGVESDVYLFCDPGRSFKQIYDYVTTKPGRQLTEGHIRQLLDEFVRGKLMYTENNKYLSLALPARRDF